MCPDRQILSVYLDGELPSPWKEKMETHLVQCPQCQKRLETWKLLAPSAAELPAEAAMQAAQERVWHNLDRRPVRTSYAAIRRIWGRRISIPLPAAAAAAIALLVLAALWMRQPAEPAAIPNITFASEEDLEIPGIIPVSDMNGVLQYLGNRDSGDILILHLPESRNFISSGEPAILKAADYSRRRP